MKELISSKSITHFSVGLTDGTDWKCGHTLPISGCMMMLCEGGNMDITINSRRFSMTEGEMAFIVFDMVVVPVKISDDFRARFITVDYDAAQDIFFLATSNRFWEFIYASTVFVLPDGFRDVVRNWFIQLDWIITTCQENTAVRVLLNEMENAMSVIAEQVEAHLGMLGANPPKNRAWTMVNEFLGLLNRYYTHRHDVAFYANKLNITPNYLNIISKRNIGTTAKEQINIQISLVVKMLLDTTDLTVKEIAERLHYDDPSYLCRIFRKQTGFSPIQYRNRNDKQR